MRNAHTVTRQQQRTHKVRAAMVAMTTNTPVATHRAPPRTTASRKIATMAGANPQGTAQRDAPLASDLSKRELVALDAASRMSVPRQMVRAASPSTSWIAYDLPAARLVLCKPRLPARKWFPPPRPLPRPLVPARVRAGRRVPSVAALPCANQEARRSHLLDELLELRGAAFELSHRRGRDGGRRGERERRRGWRRHARKALEALGALLEAQQHVR